jgi:hypothetical protein
VVATIAIGSSEMSGVVVVGIGIGIAGMGVVCSLAQMVNGSGDMSSLEIAAGTAEV